MRNTLRRYQTKKNKTSRYKRYRDGYWIKSRYLLYRWWYKFLQYAEQDEKREVDWSKYDGWGGASVVLNTRFEKWWQQRWKELFGVRSEKDKARYEIASRKARAETIRITLLVYENRDKTGRDLFDALNKRYSKLGSLDMYETDDEGEYISVNGKLRERLIDSKYINQHIKRYRQQADRLLDQVCRGEFGR